MKNSKTLGKTKAKEKKNVSIFSDIHDLTTINNFSIRICFQNVLFVYMGNKKMNVSY